MTRHIKLFTPGPADVDEDVLEAAAHPMLLHYGPAWMETYNEVIQILRGIFHTQADLFLVPGAASASIEMAIGSLAPAGGEMIVGANGFFGQRMLEMAQCYGIRAVPFTAPLGQPLDPALLRRLLCEHPQARAVALVHHETSTTVLNPLRELAAEVQAADRICIVDAVSTLGGVRLPVDEWGIDVCITSANKCFESLPGIGIISVSPRAWEQVDARTDPGTGWYLNLRTWRKYLQEWGSWHPSPVTLPVNVILALLASLRKIAAAGEEAHFARYTRASQVVRCGLESLGFEMFVPAAFAAPIATAVKARPEFTVAELSQWLSGQRGMAIAGGLGELSGKIFRVGHLGKAAEREYLLDFLFAVEEFLRARGMLIPVGASLKAL